MAESAAERFGQAIEAIDAVNAADPVMLEVDGVTRPRDLVHAERMTHWLDHLDPTATVVQRLAARAAHLRRWDLPRSAYPDGRPGYLRWRAEAKRRQASEVRSLLTEVGHDRATVERTAEIVAKEHPSADPDAQTHEDVLCLVFLELQFDDLSSRLGDDRTVEVLRRTMAKMSDSGLAAVAGIDLSTHGRVLVERAGRTNSTP